MVIDFKVQRFLKLIEDIQKYPYSYLNFDSVADFYQADWVQNLPENAIYYCTGLDDGAEDFHIVIEYEQHYLSISIHEKITVNYRDKSRDSDHFN